MPLPIRIIKLKHGDRAALEAWVRAPSTPQKVALRSRICLWAHEGQSNRQIAQQLRTSRPTVILWRKRFQEAGVAGLEHEPSRPPHVNRSEETLIKRID